jgi:hypothetical protein
MMKGSVAGVIEATFGVAPESFERRSATMRRIPSLLHYEVAVVGEKEIQITTNDVYSNEDYNQLSSLIELDADTIRYNFPPLAKTTTIQLEHPVYNRMTCHMEENTCLIVFSFPLIVLTGENKVTLS